MPGDFCKLHRLAPRYISFPYISFEILDMLRECATTRPSCCIISPLAAVFTRLPRADRSSGASSRSSTIDQYYSAKNEHGRNFLVLDQYPADNFFKLAQSFEKVLVFPEWAKLLASESVTFEDWGPTYTISSKLSRDNDFLQHSVCDGEARAMKFTQKSVDLNLLGFSNQTLSISGSNKLRSLSERVPLGRFSKNFSNLRNMVHLFSKVLFDFCQIKSTGFGFRNIFC